MRHVGRSMKPPARRVRGHGATGFLWNAASLCIALGAVCGCAPMKPGNDRGPDSGVATDSRVETGPGVVTGCAHRQPPPRPNVAGRGGALDLVFAVSSTFVGVSSYDDAGESLSQGIGYDLDNTCTGEGDGPSCVEPRWALPEHYRDGVDGIDNTAGKVFSMFRPPPPETAMATATTSTLMFRVRGYSGDPDDDQVEVSVYVGLGLAPRQDGRSGPVWDGQDRWTILPGTLVPLGDAGTVTYSVDQPRFRDDGAYVSGWVLVAHFAEALLPAGLVLAPDALSGIRQGIMSGRLVQVGAGWELQNGVGAERVKLTDVLRTAARYPSPSDPSQPLCKFPVLYQGLKDQFCAYADIASGPDSPSSPCDALSGGSRFQAKQALLGDVGPPASPLPPCAPEVPEPDTCDTLADQ
jgi:hypothetical protein